MKFIFLALALIAGWVIYCLGHFFGRLDGWHKGVKDCHQLSLELRKALLLEDELQ